ncbi:ABC transporter ATP-binding protein [Bacillus sp. SD088]|uniref:ABC transporter ATP-binding protein n=1 Tax=Bacillus sp. SD088 TaxID=2782012 RepID=UPI001A96CA6C|nr:ABC transporter ATP-binding protein [Bacillus sp. SD088]MBO0994303.1 ABC transporter ATP-binding protein [Bacillus sp. SD088]
MKNTKDKISHGFFDNMKFMFREQWSFEKKALLFPIVYIIFDLIVSLIAIWLPKVVLDSINRSVSPPVFIATIGTITIGLMVLRYFSHYSEQGVLKSTVKILNMHFYIEKDWKILDMDYALSSSPEGKIKIEKGHDATSRNILVNMASFYPNSTYLVKSLFGLISFSAIILLLHPIVIVILLISYLADAYISFLIQRMEHRIKDKRATIDNKIYYMLQEINSLAFAKDIRVYHMKNWINRTVHSYMGEKEHLENQVQTKHLMQGLFEVLLFLIRNGGGYIFLIWKMLTTDMTIGDFILFFGAITGFAQWLEEIVERFKNLTNANFSVDDYRYLLDTKDKFNRENGASLPAYDQPVELVLENVSFSYEGSDQVIIDKMNLKIHAGEKLAIVGANGAGKTTLIKLMCGLLQPVSGRILMNGTDITEYNRDEYYSLITAVFQNVSLLPMSIAQNITFCQEPEFDEEKLSNVIRQAGLSEKIEQLPNDYHTNLLPNITENGVHLSGGEIQKLMLARALYKDASLIILDEPTAALDPIAEDLMYQKYNELTQNKTSIFISHRLSSTRFCDRIIYIENGNICETGSHDELMAREGKYKEIFDVQSYYYKENSGGSLI